MDEQILRYLEGMEQRIIAVVRQELNETNRENKRYDKKLHNSKLLLRNYKRFKVHCTEAQITATQLVDKELLDMIKEGEQAEDTVYINSIMRTKERTAIMLNHIKRVLEFYMYTAENSNDEQLKRRAKVIQYKYIKGQKDEEIADKLHIHPRTVGKDIDKAVPELSPLLFGIDGVKLE